MSEVIYPGGNLIFTYNGYTGDETQTDSQGRIVAEAFEMETEEGVVFNAEYLAEDYAIDVFFQYEDGLSIAEENRIVGFFKSTQVPSSFGTYQIFVEDCNGLRATYPLDAKDLGKKFTFLMQAFVKPEGFNDSFVTKVGLHIDSPKTEGMALRIILKDFEFSSTDRPMYVEPQDVAKFLGITDNKGQPLVIAEYTNPSYSMLASRIVEAEAWF